jgi:hypothetical protein
VQEFRFGGISESGVLGMEEGTELYYRRVRSANGTVRQDQERVGGKVVSEVESSDVADSNDQQSVQLVLGRVPGLLNAAVGENGLTSSPGL